MSEKKILIVDDDDELHILYGMYLRSESYQILKAFNGQQALEILSSEKPDLIVLDMIMPVMDGETFLAKMSHDKNIKDIPVIIASVNEKIPQKFLSLSNVYATFRKPFTIETLLEKIREVFAHQN